MILFILIFFPVQVLLEMTLLEQWKLHKQYSHK